VDLLHDRCACIHVRMFTRTVGPQKYKYLTLKGQSLKLYSIGSYTWIYPVTWSFGIPRYFKSSLERNHINESLVPRNCYDQLNDGVIAFFFFLFLLTLRRILMCTTGKSSHKFFSQILAMAYKCINTHSTHTAFVNANDWNNIYIWLDLSI
jgi:hypothetical protein